MSRLKDGDLVTHRLTGERGIVVCRHLSGRRWLDEPGHAPFGGSWHDQFDGWDVRLEDGTLVQRWEAELRVAESDHE